MVSSVGPSSLPSTHARPRFDILVNGGGIITLQFQRNPFHPIKKSVLVAWNEIHVIQNPIVMLSVPDSGKHFLHYLNHRAFSLFYSLLAHSGKSAPHCRHSLACRLRRNQLVQLVRPDLQPNPGHLFCARPGPNEAQYPGIPLAQCLARSQQWRHLWRW